MMNKINFIFFLCFIVSVTGCSKNGLQRSSLDKWEKKKFSSLGITIEVPKDLKLLKVRNSKHYIKATNSRSITFFLHPVYPPVLDDAIFLITIRIIILSENNYKLFKDKKHRENFTGYFNDNSFFKEITELTAKDASGRITLLCFRKDLKNEKTGEAVLAAITYMDNYQGNTQFRDTDIKAIKRILNSIKFIDEKKAAK